jgi:acyl carrier protein
MESLDENHILIKIKSFVENSIIGNNVVLKPETNLSETGIDSFSTIEIILFIERQFGLRIPDSELTKDNLSSLKNISTTVWRLLNEPPKNEQ